MEPVEISEAEMIAARAKIPNAARLISGCVPAMRDAVIAYFGIGAFEAQNLPYRDLSELFAGIEGAQCAGGRCRGVAHQDIDLCPRCYALRAAVVLP